MKRIILILLSLTVLFGLACNEETITNPIPEKDYTADSPVECIYNLELSFNSRDIELYRAMLSPNFTFYFNQQDVGNDIDGYIIPTSWGYEEDWQATQNMFNQTYDISMQLPENDIGAPPEGATEYTAENVTVSLLVMVDENNGFIANKGYLEFTFVKVNGGGEDYWVIKDWRDFTYARKGIDSASLGEIKAVFK